MAHLRCRAIRQGKGFFLPVECVPTYIHLGGYPLETFYRNLSQIPAVNKTVVLDACFSGADVFKNMSLARVKVETGVDDPKLVVLSSSEDDEVSTWHNEQQHGLFTYFFLRGIQHPELADTNKDKVLTVGELFNFMEDKTEGVPYYSRRFHGVDQHPMFYGKNREKVLVDYHR